MEPAANTIALVAAASDVTKGPWGTAAVSVVNRSIADLREALAHEINNIASVLAGIEDDLAGFRCDEVELELEATAEGGFRLVAAGGATVGATLHLTFRREKH